MRKSDLQLTLFLVVAMVGAWLLSLVTIGWISQFGIIPRTLGGLVGIFTAPFLHGGFFHLAGNLFYLLPLAWFTSLTGKGNLLRTVVFVILLGGSLTWLLGRHANHIGASGLIFGLWGFLIANAFFQKNIRALLIAIITGLFFAGLLFALLPRTGTSFESHLFGIIAGVVAAKLCVKRNNS